MVAQERGPIQGGLRPSSSLERGDLEDRRGRRRGHGAGHARSLHLQQREQHRPNRRGIDQGADEHGGTGTGLHTHNMCSCCSRLTRDPSAEKTAAFTRASLSSQRFTGAARARGVTNRRDRVSLMMDTSATRSHEQHRSRRSGRRCPTRWPGVSRRLATSVITPSTGVKHPGLLKQPRAAGHAARPGRRSGGPLRAVQISLVPSRGRTSRARGSAWGTAGRRRR